MRTLLVVDLSAFFMSRWHSTAGQEDVDAAFRTTIARIDQVSEGVDQMVVCCDSPGHTWRHDLFNDYKAGRPERSEECIAQLRRTIKHLEDRGAIVLATPGVEADDLIAAVVAEAQAAGVHITIGTMDKDLAALVRDPLVRVYSFGKGLYLDEKAVEETMGVRPDQVRDFLALMGDKSDNVPGVDGIGKVAARQLLHDFGSVATILTVLDDATVPIPAGVRKKLLAGLGALDLSMRLVTLKDDVKLTGPGADRLFNWLGGGETSATGETPAADRDRCTAQGSVIGSDTTRPAVKAEEPGTSSAVDMQHAVGEQTSRAAEEAEEPPTSSTASEAPSMMSEKIDQLATALAKAQAEMEHAKKDSVNPHFRQSYADLASVWDAARPVLGKHGLSVVQTIRAEGAGSVLVTKLLHASGQWLGSEIPILSASNKPQEFGSALTYARRYALAAIVGVSQDDDDGEAAHGRPFQAPQQRRAS